MRTGTYLVIWIGEFIGIYVTKIAPIFLHTYTAIYVRSEPSPTVPAVSRLESTLFTIHNCNDINRLKYLGTTDAS